MSNWGHKPKQIGTHYIKSIEACVYYKHIDKKNIVLFSSWYVRYFLVDTNHDFSKVSVLYTKQNIPFWQGLCELHCPVDTHTLFEGEQAHAQTLRARGWHWRNSKEDSKRATYPSLKEASRWADARTSISMRLSCKVSRNVCFAMFLHTGGKMEMRRGWEVHARTHTHTHIGSVQCKCSGVVLLLSSTVVNLWTCDAAQAGRLLRWKVG